MAESPACGSSKSSFRSAPRLQHKRAPLHRATVVAEPRIMLQARSQTLNSAISSAENAGAKPLGGKGGGLGGRKQRARKFGTPLKNAVHPSGHNATKTGGAKSIRKTGAKSGVKSGFRFRDPNRRDPVLDSQQEVLKPCPQPTEPVVVVPQAVSTGCATSCIDAEVSKPMGFNKLFNVPCVMPKSPPGGGWMNRRLVSAARRRGRTATIRMAVLMEMALSRRLWKAGRPCRTDARICYGYLGAWTWAWA